MSDLINESSQLASQPAVLGGVGKHPPGYGLVEIPLTGPPPASPHTVQVYKGANGPTAKGKFQGRKEKLFDVVVVADRVYAFCSTSAPSLFPSFRAVVP